MIGKENFAGARGKEQDAPKPAILVIRRKPEGGLHWTMNCQIHTRAAIGTPTTDQTRAACRA